MPGEQALCRRIDYAGCGDRGNATTGGTMTETLTTSLPKIEVQTHGRGRHAECRQTFGLGRHSLLGGQSRSRRVRRRTLRRALRHYWPSLASLVLVGAVMAAAWLTASLAALPEPTPRPVVAWSTPSEVCTVVPGSGDLSCYRGEIDHVCPERGCERPALRPREPTHGAPAGAARHGGRPDSRRPAAPRRLHPHPRRDDDGVPHRGRGFGVGDHHPGHPTQDEPDHCPDHPADPPPPGAAAGQRAGLTCRGDRGTTTLHPERSPRRSVGRSRSVGCAAGHGIRRPNHDPRGHSPSITSCRSRRIPTFGMSEVI